MPGEANPEAASNFTLAALHGRRGKTAAATVAALLARHTALRHPHRPARLELAIGADFVRITIDAALPAATTDQAELRRTLTEAGELSRRLGYADNNTTHRARVWAEVRIARPARRAPHPRAATSAPNSPGSSQP
ncbi:hypothetical protein BIV57_13205 [Mangrovactinospora gilvigrisea]|uniref:Uncharacterized protein n=2 Tax=Mangrovactinospora gilvigrisea TaxID=1428644 RepID=A0A1J7BU17_9ACTN|nr:hypothetical protein BIV57_13205 [Mangrovactinospora gilvigrisea]